MEDLYRIVMLCLVHKVLHLRAAVPQVRDLPTVERLPINRTWREAGLRGSFNFVSTMVNQLSDDVKNCIWCKYFKLKMKWLG